MDKELIELIILNYVDLIFVDSNPVKIENTQVFKQDGKLIKNTSSNEYNLIKLNIDSINSQIFNEFKEIEDIFINFYSKNIIGRFLKIKKYYNLYKELESLDNNNWIITNRYIYDNFLSKKDINVYINELMVDKIIIGNKSDKILIRVDNDNIEYYLDKTNIKSIILK